MARSTEDARDTAERQIATRRNWRSRLRSLLSRALGQERRLVAYHLLALEEHGFVKSKCAIRTAKLEGEGDQGLHSHR